eukprot:10217173-Lingulodinium_polyedra.AAC.1
MLSHAQYQLELFDARAVPAFGWADARDVCVNGVTKGAVDRYVFHQFAVGLSIIVYGVQRWAPKGRLSSSES